MVRRKLFQGEVERKSGQKSEKRKDFQGKNNLNILKEEEFSGHFRVYFAQKWRYDALFEA